jgi:hypothetical protein
MVTRTTIDRLAERVDGLADRLGLSFSAFLTSAFSAVEVILSGRPGSLWLLSLGCRMEDYILNTFEKDFFTGSFIVRSNRPAGLLPEQTTPASSAFGVPLRNLWIMGRLCRTEAPWQQHVIEHKPRSGVDTRTSD